MGWSRTKRGKRFLRRAASGALGLALRMRSRRFGCAGIRRALVISPHPDDETFGCGGTLAAMGSEGVHIYILFVTDGGASHLGNPAVSRAEMVSLRRAEARSAAEALGVDWANVSFLDVPDGSLAHLSVEQSSSIVDRISERLRVVHPDTLLLPYRNDGSSEHEQSFVLASRAIGKSGIKPRVLEFPVWSLWNPVLLLPAVLESGRIWRSRLGSVRATKARAIACYASQTRAIAPDTRPALPAGFESMFLGVEEFLIEHQGNR